MQFGVMAARSKDTEGPSWKQEELGEQGRDVQGDRVRGVRNGWYGERVVFEGP